MLCYPTKGRLDILQLILDMALHRVGNVGAALDLQCVLRGAEVYTRLAVVVLSLPGLHREYK